MKKEFHTNPEDIESARERAGAYHTELLERLRLRGKSINGSNGNPGGRQYPPVSEAVGKAVFDGHGMSIYKNSAGDRNHMKVVAHYFEEMGIRPPHSKITVEHVAPGYGVTNLYSVILPKIKKDAEQKYEGKEPVMLMTSPTYGLYTVQPEDTNLPIVTVQLHEDKGWKLQPDDVERVIRETEAAGDKKVVAYYNMNPHNPTGAILGDKEVTELAGVFKKHDVFVIDDMIYHGTEYGKTQAKPFAAVPGMFDHSITLLGLSKAFCTPGIRAAAACGRVEDIEYIKERNSALLGSIGTPSQVALSAAYSNEHGNKNERADYFRRNNENYMAKKKLLQVMIEGSDKVPITADEKEEYLRLMQKIMSMPRKDIEVALQKGIPGVRIANDAESGYFSLIDFSGVKDKYCGEVKVENATIMAAAMADLGKTTVLPSGYMLAGKEYPMMARITYAMEPEGIIRMTRGIRQTVAKLTDEPNPSLPFDLNNPHAVNPGGPVNQAYREGFDIK